MRSQLKLYGVFVPVRSAPPPPRGARQSGADLNGVWGDEPTEIFHATRPPIPSFAPPQPPFNYRSSGRPLKSPPSVPQRPENAALQQLYDQSPSMMDEVMVALRTKNANSPPPDDPHNRPNKPPPPPPAKHATPQQKPTDKPSIPTKPISVKMLAARFDAKSAHVDL